MHLLRNTKAIPASGRFGGLPPGEWLADDRNCAELLLMGELGTCTISDKWHNVAAPDANGFLIVRSGAIGDLLLLSPALAAFRAKNPETRIALSCFPMHHEVVCDLEVEVVEYPFPLSRAQEFSQVLSLENLMEMNHEEHATDIFAKALNVTVADYKPVFILSDLEQLIAQGAFPKNSRIRVGVQPKASVANRDYPIDQWLQVMGNLVKKQNCEIFLFGHPGQVPPIKDHYLTDLTTQERSFRQMAAILSTCDVFCGVDSALLHLCHALDVPAVGLYGPFDPKTRVSMAPRTLALKGHGECAPCSWHKHAGNAFPDRECRKTQKCSVLAEIKPERIVAKILSQHASSAR